MKDHRFLTGFECDRLIGDEISHAFCLPRTMGLEYQLNQMGKANASLEELVAKIRDGIDKFRVRGSVSGPFSWGRISGVGFESLGF